MTGQTNGAAMAALLAAGIGAGAMGLFVMLNESGAFTAPALYGPAGGVSGRTAFATMVWLIAWILLHTRWKQRQVAAHAIHRWTLVLTVLGLLMTFPPVWAVFG
jgi:hypothetical protein